MINGKFNRVVISCAKDAGSKSDLLLSSSTTACCYPACQFTAAVNDPEPTVLQNWFLAGTDGAPAPSLTG